jgi:RNA polymerase sigma factor (sigma-70 family)
MSNESVVVGWRERWNRNLLKFLGRRMRVAVDVEDLAQETYLRLLRARDLGDVRNPRAYLLRVASHVVAEWHERQPATSQLTTLSDELADVDLNPELGIQVDISQARLDEALAVFPALTRAVLTLRFRDECTYREIAAALSLSERQVRRHLTRGFAELRKDMGR